MPRRRQKKTTTTKATTSKKKPSNRRLDTAVAELANVSRERARALIMAGGVFVDGAPATKAGSTFAASARIEIKDEGKFVSRGGVKLERALDEFGWQVSGLRCLDVGASTGGFTDCLLQRGAAAVVAVDVGYGQFAWRLRNDPRVTLIERANFRYVDPTAIGGPFDFACLDLSFISLTKVAPKIREALSESGELVALVKPQFEAGRTLVGRGGVVRDPAVQTRAIEDVIASFAAVGIASTHLTYSPVKGPAGNIEFLVGALVGARPANVDAAGVVAAAHEALDK
jgi:23S rRNA (cytidine1920-2'-O)/16S rRNA (cytidine1409-2'-O)-methyltransferase